MCYQHPNLFVCKHNFLNLCFVFCLHPSGCCLSCAIEPLEKCMCMFSLPSVKLDVKRSGWPTLCHYLLPGCIVHGGVLFGLPGCIVHGSVLHGVRNLFSPARLPSVSPLRVGLLMCTSCWALCMAGRPRARLRSITHCGRLSSVEG